MLGNPNVLRRRLYYVQDQFEIEWEAAGSFSDMMLVYVELPNLTMQLFVGMPEAGQLSRYRGFEPCLQPMPSQKPKLLMGDLKQHDRLFGRLDDTSVDRESRWPVG